nr:MAG: hypothetical protein [Bacteriophage sp.]
MGKIKKILENELVGGTQGTDVYPVTSTKAVYDENNVRLDTILKPATKEAAGLMSPEDKKNIDDKLSKSEGGEVNKHIVVTNNNSEYSLTTNPDGSVYIWNKKSERNIFSIVPSVNNTIISGDNVSISGINSLSAIGYYNQPIYSSHNDTFTGSKFKLRTGTNKQVLLGDGSTTDQLIKDVTAGAIQSEYNFNFISTGNMNTFVTIKAATSTTAGVMTAADKTKLDDIPKIYAEKSKTISNIIVGNRPNKRGLYIAIDYADRTNPGTTVNIPNATTTSDGCMSYEDKNKLDNIKYAYVSSQDGNIYSSYDTNNGNTTLDISGNYDEDGSGGRIRLKRTEDGKGKLSIMIDGTEGSVNAETFKSISNPNENEVWSTDGGRINVLNLLSNAAIYVAGGFELAESGIDNTTVLDSPDRIIYDASVLGGRFLARKGMICYTHWKADISKNIAPPSRYGIETDNGVFPFNNQMYKFSVYDSVFIATCSDGKCTMKHLQ